jgi:predicted ArsR family transcriptional regulator
MPRGLALRAGMDLRHTDVVKYMRQLDATTVAAGHDTRAPVDAAAVRPQPGGAHPGERGTGERGTSERGTRARVARLILENGPITAFALSSRLGLTPAAIRRHLDALLADRMIEARKARVYGSRGRGRPAKVFAITDAGRSAFEHAYDDLASSALRFLARTRGLEAVAEFAREQIADLEWRYRPVVEAAPTKARVQALAAALTADGYAASADIAPAGGGQQLCQHHCPVAHVAAEFPQLCEAETEAFGRLLGTPVQRLATIAHGDGICTTHVTDLSMMRSPGISMAGSSVPTPDSAAQAREPAVPARDAGDSDGDSTVADSTVADSTRKSPITKPITKTESGGLS